MADAKPATDADVDHYRNLHSHLARALVARIDKEIKDRLAAEARVKVLKEALRKIAALSGPTSIRTARALAGIAIAKAEGRS